MSNGAFRNIRWHLLNETLGMSDFLQFILDGDLELKNLISILLVLNLLSNFLSIGVETSLVETLGMVELVAINLREELSQLIIHICRLSVILNVIVTMTQQREGCSISG